MKIPLRPARLALALLTLATCNLALSTAHAQGTAFTYQGRLNNGTNPVTGSYDLTFSLFNASSSGAQVGGTVTNLAVGVTNGLFTTTLDFGPVFAGNPTWLAISVRTNGTGGFTSLSPLQALTPTPYAITAGSANSLAGLSVQFNTAGGPNLIGGSPDNYVSAGVIGATISGGGATNIHQGGPHAFSYTNSVTGSFGTVGGGEANSAGSVATASGGEDNSASGQLTTVGGGLENNASGTYSTVGGGVFNVAGGSSLGAATVAGGFQNNASGDDATVGGGFNNQATNTFATVPGGAGNVAGGQSSFAAGNNAQATHDGAFVWADSESGTPFGSTTTNEFSVRANGGVRFVTGGAGMTLDGLPVMTNFAYLSTPGNGNFFAGQSAGNASLSGSSDIGVGSYALQMVGSGSYDTGEGLTALQYDTTGGFNSGFGAFALQWVTTGSYNTASGVYALSAEPTYLTGSGNTADGAYTLYSLGAGSNNVAVGYGAMQDTASDNGVVAVGYQALQNDSGTGGYLTIGSANVAVGYEALQADTSGADNTAIGYQALNKTVAGYNNSAIGTWALLSNNNGHDDTANGAYALLANTSGYQNTANGSGALANNTTGYYNTATGNGALGANTTGNFNTADGAGALAGGAGTAGTANTASGANALFSLTTGYNNVAAGYQALFTNTVGFDNVAIGVATFQNNIQGHQNTAVGTYAFQNQTSGSGNVGVGYYAGNSLISGNNNIYIGSPGAASDNNVIRIGNGQSQIFLSGPIQGNIGINGGLNVDPSGLNIGNVNSNALTFGASSGEGIASKRSGNYPYDLEFWTDFTERLKIAQGGNVGINTDNPSQTLEVNGNYALIDGGAANNGDGPIEAYIGGSGSGSDVQIGSMNSSITAVGFWNPSSSSYMHIYCSSITIEGGSDLAEPFRITKAEQPVTEGEVVVIDEANPGQLKLTDQPYDTRVAGVVSGANGIHPGIQMQQQGLLEGGKNVALTGRVYVQADTSNGAIKPGDLLTTSSTPGRAMRVSDHARAQGAILGKAMTALPAGRGMVLVLVTLQ